MLSARQICHPSAPPAVTHSGNKQEAATCVLSVRLFVLNNIDPAEEPTPSLGTSAEGKSFFNPYEQLLIQSQ